MKIQVTTRTDQTREYELPEQFNSDNAVREIEEYVASTHADHMIYVEEDLAFIDWSKGFLVVFSGERDVANNIS